MTVRPGRALNDLVAGLDPEAGRSQAVVMDSRARADLVAILASERPAVPLSRPRAPAARHRRYLAVPVAAAVAVVLLVMWPGGGPGGMGGRGGTAELPDDNGTGRYAHLVTRTWSLFTSVDGKRVTSAVVPQRTESWIGPDGAGRTVTTVERPGRSPRRDAQEYRSGQLAADADLRSLSADDRVLAEQLERSHPVENGPAERLVAIKDTYGQVPVPPVVRAALLRYLAATPTLTATGTVTDRAGRKGVAFSLDSDYSGLPTRYTLIIDPDTGKLLASEDTLTTRAGALNVPIPAVISYNIYLDANYTDRHG